MEGYVYLLRARKPFEECYKIGMTTDPKQRFRTFGVKLPYPVDVLMVSKEEDCRKEERRLHGIYAHKRLDGEWFNLSERDVQEIILTNLAVEAMQLVDRLSDKLHENLKEYLGRLALPNGTLLPNRTVACLTESRLQSFE